MTPLSTTTNALARHTALALSALMVGGILACADPRTSGITAPDDTSPPGTIGTPETLTPPASPPAAPALVMAYGEPGAAATDDRISLPIVVRAYAGQTPTAGITVRFAMKAGSGSVSPTEVVTDANGEARTILTYPYDEQNTVEARAGEYMYATTSVGSYRNHEGVIRPTSGYFLDGVLGQPLAEPLKVRVVGRDLKTPLAGRTVRFTIDMGGGSLSAATATTDAAGEASVTWTLGRTESINRVNVSGDRLIPFTIHAIARR
ncbi:MAG TPA: hypothetical protein VFZ21_29740 [Gemmatimonadaceae bacterium]|nr:hypothetical protein [Gemmatimonadaceae bacterium]